MASPDEGYEDERFVNAVPRYLHCPICLNVLKNPMQCEKNEHSFCQPCITRHLQETQRCPTCIQPLTLETLRPSRLVREFVSQLIVHCDYYSRGCPVTVKIEALQHHVDNCEFSPVMCLNDGCGLILNRRDKPDHEMNECNFRKGKCEVCGKEVPYGKQMLHCYVTKKEMNGIKKSVEETKHDMKEIKKLLTNLKSELSHQRIDMRAWMSNMQRQIDDIREGCQKSSEIAQSSSLPNVGVREDIIIAGGEDLKSAEQFSWTGQQWTLLPPMTSTRYFSTSFVHREKLFLCGGEWSDSIEVLGLKDDNKQWTKFPCKLPQKTWSHASVVYGDSLFIFGGKCGSRITDGVYLVPLDDRYVSETFKGRLPQPRAHHGAQRFEDKVVIVGGTTTGSWKDALDSVLICDISAPGPWDWEKKFQSQLPFAVSNMATVAWKDSIVIIGGVNGNGKVLNTVVAYNVTHSQSKMLPQMKHKRSDCAAVATDYGIVVMGGFNEKGPLDYVELFNFYNYTWEELPPMKEKRCGATAIVKSL